MRDFAKHYKKSSSSSKQKNVHDQDKPSNLRKIILIFILVVLIAIFLLTLYKGHKADQKKGLSTQSSALTAQSSKQTAKPAIVQQGIKQPKPTIDNTSQPNDLQRTQTAGEILQPLPSAHNDNPNKQVEIDNKVSSQNNTVEAKNQSASHDNAAQTQPLEFTFYNTLTHKSVKVDVDPAPIKQYRYTYMLQVGSFRTQNDANATRAKLILVGLKPTISKVGQWYRVDVGPVYSKRDGDVIKHKVERAGISGSYLRLVDQQEITQATANTQTRSP